MSERSLYAVARLELELITQPDAVEDAWHDVVQQPEQTPQLLPPGTPISTVFENFGRALLILGAPGTGKTTLLMELTKDLLARAEQDLNHPLPVVFHLSSWAVRQSPLADWLVDELCSVRYPVPRKHAQSWIDKDLILPLLDGLDEVTPEYHSACVEAINEFRQQHGFVPIAVCSRQADYEALTVKLRLQGALVVQKLSRLQIDDYLAQAGAGLAGIRAALREDETHWERLLNTPLMLWIATTAYQEGLMMEIQRTSNNTLEAQLFTQYIGAMFKRRAKTTLYTPQQTIKWLAWLAANMIHHHNEHEFHLEQLQPDWLPVSGSRVNFLATSIYKITFGLLLGVSSVFLVILSSDDEIPFIDTILSILMIGLVGVFIAPGRDMVINHQRNRETINLVEDFAWQLPPLNVLLSFCLIFILSFCTALYLDIGVGPKVSILVIGIVILSQLMIKEKNVPTHTSPNNGFVLSLKNSLSITLAISLITSASFSILGGLLFDEHEIQTTLIGSMIFGLYMGLSTGLEHGGFACLQHLVLRFLLWRNDFAPWHYARFLNYATERTFLKKVGGGYQFFHNKLLDHFASLRSH